MVGCKDELKTGSEWVCVEVVLQRVVSAGDVLSRLMLVGPGDDAAGRCWRRACRTMPLPPRVTARSREGALLLPYTPLRLLLPLQPITMIHIPPSWQHGWSDSEDEDSSQASKAQHSHDVVDGNSDEKLLNLKRRALDLLEQCSKPATTGTVAATCNGDSRVGEERGLAIVEVQEREVQEREVQEREVQEREVQAREMQEQEGQEVGSAPPRRRRRVRRRRRASLPPDSAPPASAPPAPAPPASAPSPPSTPPPTSEGVAITREPPVRAAPRLVRSL